MHLYDIMHLYTASVDGLKHKEGGMGETKEAVGLGC